MFRNSSHPQSITHPCDENHVLFLTSAAGSSCSCNACGEKADGWCYRCRDCDINLHTSCASMPMTLFHRSHHHQLALVFSVPYPSFTCYLCCRMGSGQWTYRCGLCQLDFHLGCAGMEQGEGYRVHAHHQVQSPHPSVHYQYQMPLPGPYPMPYNAANSSYMMGPYLMPYNAANSSYMMGTYPMPYNAANSSYMTGPYLMPYNAANSSYMMHHAAAPSRPSMNMAGGGALGTMFMSSAIGGAFQALGNLLFNGDLGDF